jgi:hypothetical protein
VILRNLFVRGGFQESLQKHLGISIYCILYGWKKPHFFDISGLQKFDKTPAVFIKPSNFINKPMYS